jgi:hypothetical protein
MNKGYSKIRDIMHRYSDLVAEIRERYGVGSERISASETGQQVVLHFQDAGLAWIRTSFARLARRLMSKKLKEARFNTTLVLHVHNLVINLGIVLSNRKLVISNCAVGKSGGRPAELPAGAVKSYRKLQESLEQAQGEEIKPIFSLLYRLEKRGVKITIDLTFDLLKGPLVNRLSRSAPDQEKIFVSCYFFSEELNNALAKAPLLSLEKQPLERQFFRTGKKTVIVMFGAEGVLQGDFLSVCGKCSVGGIKSAFEAPSQEKFNEFAARLDFRANVCSLELPSQLLPESFRTIARTQDKSLSDIQDELKRLEALLAIFSLANRVYKKRGSKRYESCFEGQGMTRFSVQKEDIKEEYSVQKEDTEEEREECIKYVIALYDWTYENISYDKIGIIRNIIARYDNEFDKFLQRAKDIGESARSSYQFYLKTKIESYFETKRKIRELIDGFARETASEVARLTKELNENIYKTAGLIAAAVIAVLIRPENTLLILAIGGGVLVLFLLSILMFHLPTMRTQFENRKKQYIDDVNLFSEALEEKEREEYRKNETVEGQKKLFLKKFDGAQKVYIGFIVFVVVALAVFFIVQQATST